MQVMIKNLEQVVSMVLNSFQDPHPRVRWAAINAIGQLATDLGPDLQVQYHQRVLPALATAMDDFHNPRVQVSSVIYALIDRQQNLHIHTGSVLYFRTECTFFVCLFFWNSIKCYGTWLLLFGIIILSFLSFILHLSYFYR